MDTSRPLKKRDGRLLFLVWTLLYLPPQFQKDRGDQERGAIK